MDRLSLILSFTLIFSFNASAQEVDKGLEDYFFKLIPESKAHTSSGIAYATELDSKSVKTLIWNIKKAERKDWESEFHSYAKDQDLILIQEAYQNERFNSTAESFSGVRWDMGISFLYRRYNDTATGTMIGSKVEPSDVLVKHTVDFEPVVNTPKAMTFATYPISQSDEELLVISVHGINITSYSAFTRHMKQAEREIEKHQGPILFAGDFNTRTKSRTSYLMALVKRHGLETVNFENGNYRMRWKFTSNYLDHSFTRGLKVKSAKVIPDSFGSDHKPLMLEFSVDHLN